MSKSQESKAAVQSHAHGPVAAQVHLLQQRTAALHPAAGEEPDPQESVVRATAMSNQVGLAANDGTPLLLLWNGLAQVPTKAVFEMLLAELIAAINKPGGRVARKEAPRVSPIDHAIAHAEQVRRRTAVACEGSPFEAEKNEAVKRQIFADRIAPGGKVRWVAELSSMAEAMERMDAPPPAVAAMLPIVKGALAQMQSAQPLPVGRFSNAFIYSSESVRCALTVELAVGDFRSWAASQATPARYGAILKATSPKRQTDAKPGEPTAPSAQPQTASSGVVPPAAQTQPATPHVPNPAQKTEGSPAATGPAQATAAQAGASA